jgi:2,3-bisphosphoglycerate-independent phosphoglycerate mutase
MKYAIVIPDGMADRPIESLDGNTPLELADTANMDRIVAMGRLGRVRTVPEDQSPGSDVAMMSIMGYEPAKYHPGRAALEAANLGLDIGQSDAAFRCNLVTISDETMADYSAGQITSKEAQVLIDTLNERLGSDTVSFHLGTGYRHIMLVKGGSSMQVKCMPPHDILGSHIERHYPSGADAKLLCDLMDRSRVIFEEHELNRVRLDLNENPASMIWLWGMGRRPHMPPFQERFNQNGAAISAVDLVNGIAKIIGWDRIKVEGATAGLDTNYEGKGEAAVQAVSAYDVVLVHVEATDEAGHAASVESKIDAIHKVDAFIVGPLLSRLCEEENYRMMVLPDHPTPIEVRTHTSDPVPFALCGSNVAVTQHEVFNEKEALDSELIIEPGHELMEYFLFGRA